MCKKIFERKKNTKLYILSVIFATLFTLIVIPLKIFNSNSEKIAQVNNVQLKATSSSLDLSQNSDAKENEKSAVLPIKISHTDFEIDTIVKSITLITNGSRVEQPAPPDNKLAKVEIYRKSMDSSIVEIVFDITIKNIGNSSGYVDNVYSYLPSALTNSSKDWETDGDAFFTDQFGEIEPEESVTRELVVQGDATIIAGLNESEVILLSSDDINQRIIEKEEGRPLSGDDVELVKDTNNYSQADTIVSVSTGDEHYNFIWFALILLIIGAGGIYFQLKH